MSTYSLAHVLAKVELVNLVKIRTRLYRVELLDPPIRKPIHPAVQNRAALLNPSFLNYLCLGEVPKLLMNVELNEPISLGVKTTDVQDLVLVHNEGVLNLLEPLIEDAVAMARQGCPDAATSVMTAHDHMLYLEELHGILEHARQVDVRWIHEVCDISVSKYLSWLRPGHLLGGHAAV